MNSPGEPSPQERYDAERAARNDQMAHRRASDAAGRVAAFTLLVAVYAVLVAVLLAIAWGLYIARGDSAPRATWAHAVLGGSVAAVLLAGGAAAYGAYRTSGAALADGQGLHVALIMSAGGSFGLGMVLIAMNLLLDQVGRGMPVWIGCCGFSGFAPIAVAGMNVWVWLRHGAALRRDERFVEGL